MVKESGLSILTAREYFAAIKASVVQGGFNNQADAYFKFILISRTNHSTLDQFLAAFNTRYIKAKECNMGTTPAQSIVHLTALVRTTWNTTASPETYTHADYLKFLQQARDKAKVNTKTSTSIGAAAAPRSQSNNNNKDGTLGNISANALGKRYNELTQAEKEKL
ncbi:hypothetical protein EJ08DRAFT_702336 [Tothia fuscella]|uniref:Uncharacterized protein n=1 Tax=Tothia fuscella TaxID=1048955 RepID=A0A9P4NGY9_9PEZI|nr:hypothetical protein EJ08DRAFT_702336 [Tothia fuscella]